MVGVRAHLIWGRWDCHSLVAELWEDPQPAELLVLPPLCSGDMPTGQKGRKKGRQGQEEAGPAEPKVAHQDKGIRAGPEAARRRGKGGILFHQF